MFPYFDREETWVRFPTGPPNRKRLLTSLVSSPSISSRIARYRAIWEEIEGGDIENVSDRPSIEIFILFFWTLSVYGRNRV